MKKITILAVFFLLGCLHAADDKGQPAELINNKIVQLPSGSELTKRFTGLIKIGDAPPLVLQIASEQLSEDMLKFVPHPRPVLVRLAEGISF